MNKNYRSKASIYLKEILFSLIEVILIFSICVAVGVLGVRLHPLLIALVIVFILWGFYKNPFIPPGLLLIVDLLFKQYVKTELEYTDTLRYYSSSFNDKKEGKFLYKRFYYRQYIFKNEKSEIICLVSAEDFDFEKESKITLIVGKYSNVILEIL